MAKQVKTSANQPIDLRRLPSWLQCVISISVVVLIALLAWIIGRDQPVPAWVSDGVVPALAWVFFGLLAVVAVGAAVRRVRRGKAGPGRDGPRR